MRHSFERMRAWLDVGATIAMLVAACAVIVATWRTPAAGESVTPVTTGEDISSQGLRVAPDPLQRVGQPSARIAVVEFADFECPYCSLYARTTLPRVRRELIESGTVAYSFMHFPLNEIHPRAISAAVAAVCAARQGRFWEMHETLFQASGAVPEWDAWAADHTGTLDQTSFEECSRTATDVVAAQRAEGERLGINGTPTLLVGTVRPDGQIELKTRLEGAVSFDAIDRAVRSIR